MTYKSVFAPDLFAGQIIIVTGGGSGIGRCTAHELARLGATVAIVGRKIEKLDAVAAEIIEDGGKVSAHVCDIRDEATVIATIEAILAQHGKIDGLVNNAGGQYRSALSEVSTKGFEAVVKNNLTGGFIFMREVYNRWMEAHGGNIVNMIADIWHGWPNFAHSAASRGGMHTLSESAASEWAASNVRVNTVAPGAIASSGLDTYDVKHTAYIQREIAQEIPCSASAMKPRCRRPSSFCCHRRPRTSPDRASASTAAGPTRGACGTSSRRPTRTSPSMAFTVPNRPRFSRRKTSLRRTP